MNIWFLPLMVSGCADLPRDPNGTLDRVMGEHRIRIGEVDGGSAPAWRGVVSRIENATCDCAIVRRGMLEPLLLELEAGELDLVVGARFDRKTPWATRVTLGPPLSATGGDRPTAEHVVTRNGENAWIMLVQRAVKAEAER